MLGTKSRKQAASHDELAEGRAKLAELQGKESDLLRRIDEAEAFLGSRDWRTVDVEIEARKMLGEAVDEIELPDVGQLRRELAVIKKASAIVSEHVAAAHRRASIQANDELRPAVAALAERLAIAIEELQTCQDDAIAITEQVLSKGFGYSLPVVRHLKIEELLPGWLAELRQIVEQG